MASLKEIEEKINSEREKGRAILLKEKADFFNATYDGFLPKNFYQLFADAIFMLAPRVDNVAAAQIAIWKGLKPEEYNFGMVGKMAEVISLVPRVDIFQNLDEANEKLQPIEQLMEEHRLKMEAFSVAHEDKKNKLEEKLYRMKAGLMQGKPQQKSKKELRKEQEKRSEMQAVPTMEVATAEA